MPSVSSALYVHLTIHLRHYSIGPKGGPTFEISSDAPSLWLVHHSGPHDALGHDALCSLGPGCIQAGDRRVAFGRGRAGWDG